MRIFAICLILCAWTSVKAQDKIDTIYTETYTGFLDGEIGDCIGDSEYCDIENTVIFPIGAPLQKLADMRYKRIFEDSTHTRIAREYIKGEDSVYLFAAYHPKSGKMIEYGGLYLKYNPIVYSKMEAHNTIIAVQPIEIQKMGFWQESLNLGLKAGYYVGNEPIASWKYFSLPMFLDLNLPSEIWTYNRGEIISRDTVNLIEKKISETQVTKILLAETWYLKGENKSIVYFQNNAHKYPHETWKFDKDGTLTIAMHTSKENIKTFTGTWQWHSPLKLMLEVPNFANLTLDLRYLTDNKMLFLK